MKKTQKKHHMFPTSLGGIDEEANIIYIPEDIHIKLHQTMNLDKVFIRISMGLCGIFQKIDKHNKWYLNPSKVQGVLKLQKLYYSNYIKLEQGWLRKRHIEKLNELASHFRGNGRKLPYEPDFKKLWKVYAHEMSQYYIRQGSKKVA